MLAGGVGGQVLRLIGGTSLERNWAIVLVSVFGVLQVLGDWGHPSVFWQHVAFLALVGIGIVLGHRLVSLRGTAKPAT